jgi:hypothetical protein
MGELPRRGIRSGAFFTFDYFDTDQRRAEETNVGLVARSSGRWPNVAAISSDIKRH